MIAKIEEFDDKWFATLEGEMDTAAALEAQKVLKPLYNGGGKNVLIECGKLEYIASSGLRILLGILKSAIATGSTVTLRNMNDDVKKVFALTGLDKIFKFEP